MDTDLETLATALYVTADDLLKAHPEILPLRPRVGIAPAITDAEVLTLAAIAPLVGINTERRFLRYARKHLTGMFPYIPGQSGYNKRLRALAGTIGWLAAALATTSAHTIIADKGYRSKGLEDDLNQAGLTLLRPAARNEAPRPGAGLLRLLRQRIESVFDTLKDQLGLERHNGRTPTAVTARVAQRILALTAVIWHNDKTGNPRLRSLTPYDH